MLKKLSLTFFLIAIHTVALANEAKHIEVSQPFAREVPPMAMASASFMTLTNTSSKDILLVSAESSVAKNVELHTHINDGGVMRMREVPNIKIPAMGKTQLKPGGLHIMFIHLQKTLKAGNQVSVKLNFNDGSSKTVTMPVKSLKGMMHKNHNQGHGGHHHGHHHGHH